MGRTCSVFDLMSHRRRAAGIMMGSVIVGIAASSVDMLRFLVYPAIVGQHLKVKDILGGRWQVRGMIGVIVTPPLITVERLVP